MVIFLGWAARTLTKMEDHTVTGIGACPAPVLREYVDSYVGFDLRGFPTGVHCGPPSRALTAVISLSDPSGRARLSYRRAEEIFEENTRLLANPLASPDDIEDLDGWTLHRLRHIVSAWFPCADWLQLG